MSRLTVRLPDTLHQQLETLAKRDNVSLNQYIVYALAQQTALAYTVRAVPDDDVIRQRDDFDALRQSLGQAAAAEIDQALAGRDAAVPEPDLAPETVDRLRGRIANAKPTP